MRKFLRKRREREGRKNASMRKQKNRKEYEQERDGEEEKEEKKRYWMRNESDRFLFLLIQHPNIIIKHQSNTNPHYIRYENQSCLSRYFIKFNYRNRNGSPEYYNLYKSIERRL